MLNTEQLSITKIIVLGLQILSPYVIYLADIFLILCLFLFGFTLYKQGSRLAELAPTLLTGLSLFGSFLIAFIGISVFNPNALDDSLPNLLSHLGIALFIGLIGLFLALIIKAINHKIAQTQSSDVTPTVIYLVLKEISTHNVALKSLLSNMAEQLQTFQTQLEEITKLQKKGFGQQVRSLEEIKQNIIQEGENSLVANLQNETKKGFDKLIAEFRTVADKVATENSQTAIKAMNHIQDIGFIENIERSRDALQVIATQTTAIPKTMQQLAQLMQGLNQQLDNMGSYLDSFQRLREQAGDAFPVIENNLNNLTQGMQQVLQRNLELLEMTLETQLDMAEASLETQLEGFQALQNHFAALTNQAPRNVLMSEPTTSILPTIKTSENKDERIDKSEIPLEMLSKKSHETSQNSDHLPKFVSDNSNEMIEKSEIPLEMLSKKSHETSQNSDHSPKLVSDNSNEMIEKSEIPLEMLSENRHETLEYSEHSPKVTSENANEILEKSETPAEIVSNDTDEVLEKLEVLEKIVSEERDEMIQESDEILSETLPEKRSEKTLETIEEFNQPDRVSENRQELESQESDESSKMVTEETAFKPFNSNEFEVLQDKAYTFMELNRYEEAIGYFQQALALKPDEFSLCYNEACCYALLGQVEPAIMALQQAMALNAECQIMAQTDSDFDVIRSAPEFQFLFQR
jgi:tetratricopeptide (TPR) repeat protein